MFKKQFLITEMFPTHCNTDFQSHQKRETKLPPLLRFLLSHQRELNPIPIQGEKLPLTSKVKTKHLWISTDQMPFLYSSNISAYPRGQGFASLHSVIRMLLTCFIFVSKVFLLQLALQVRCFTICLQASVFPEPLSPLQDDRQGREGGIIVSFTIEMLFIFSASFVWMDLRYLHQTFISNNRRFMDDK